ncbi:N-acetylmuramoyl-L-alanine amidase [Streptococcus dentapri]|uniref:N-acetylmuramoyl-L-alanine amidase n=1 Tax=Streptococcus dentapri TaxID=573564 RepID=A0ABV8CZ55_9STRE
MSTSIFKSWTGIKKSKYGREYLLAGAGIIITLGLSIFLLKAYVFYGKSELMYSYQADIQMTSHAKQTSAVYTDIHTLKGTAVVSSGTPLTVIGYDVVKHRMEKQVYARIKIDDEIFYIQAKSLALKQDNPVNAYIARLDYPKVEIKENIYSGFKKSPYQTKTGKAAGIVIHDTGTENSTVKDEITHMENQYADSGVFVHTFIDDKTIMTIANPNYEAQGAGLEANPYYLQFEMTHVYTKQAFTKQIANAAYYTAYMLKINNLAVTLGKKDGSGTVWTHDRVSRYLGGTNHIDPKDYWSDSAGQFFGSSYDEEDFIQLVQTYYNQL